MKNVYSICPKMIAAFDELVYNFKTEDGILIVFF